MKSLNAVKYVMIWRIMMTMMMTIPTIQNLQGTDITAKLKKVSDDEKTHKNPALRGDGLVIFIITIVVIIIIIREGVKKCIF